MLVRAVVCVGVMANAGVNATANANAIIAGRGGPAGALQGREGIDVHWCGAPMPAWWMDGMMGQDLAHVAGRRREGAGLDAGGHEHLEDRDRDFGR